MTLIFLREARDEFLEAISYYEAERPGLGTQFKTETDRTVQWVTEHPELARLRPGGYRRVNLRVFPYYVSYITRGDNLWILASPMVLDAPITGSSVRNRWSKASFRSDVLTSDS